MDFFFIFRAYALKFHFSKYKKFFMGFRFLKCKEFFSGFPFPEVQENIIKFLISEPESSISQNIRKYKNFFRVDIFLFFEVGFKKCGR